MGFESTAAVTQPGLAIAVDPGATETTRPLPRSRVTPGASALSVPDTGSADLAGYVSRRRGIADAASLAALGLPGYAGTHTAPIDRVPASPPVACRPLVEPPTGAMMVHEGGSTGWLGRDCGSGMAVGPGLRSGPGWRSWREDVPTGRVSPSRGTSTLPAAAPPRSAPVFDGGRPTPPRTLRDVLEATVRAVPGAAAIDVAGRVLDYRTLVGEVDALAARLAGQGIGAGDRVGVRVPSGTCDLYVAILAILWVGAAYVPVDMDDPDERAELVFAEAGVCAVIGADRAVSVRGTSRGRVGARRPRPGDDAWIIFTSGSTGKPKGVAVTHGSAAAFVDAEARLFLRDRPLAPGDRVLAGLSVAFDASCEEMWLAWRHGACLVPAPRSLVRSGADLGDWLGTRRISVVSTVPTLAALWAPEQLRGIRLLILGGEACPPELAHRLAAQCPEVWNTYGPTETTVVACAARMRPGEPVRIGLPLQGWQLAVVDPQSGHPVEWGQIGELVIAGIGTARYLDPEKDAAKFPPLPALGWRRAYRSGDLVRADPEGLSFVGRADTQVKIRGFRVELSEIESVLLQLPGVGQAVVSSYSPTPGVVELVGYYSPALGSAVDPHGVRAALRSRLPAHMVPAYIEELAAIPTMTSGKADRKALPPPRRRAGAAGAGEAFAAPVTQVETVLAEVLAEVLDIDRVSVDSHFFDDLGANSLLLAHFCARVRQRGGLPPVAMPDVYQNPTVRTLAAALPSAAPMRAPLPAAPAPPPPPARVSTGRFVVFGAAQLVLMLVPLVVTAGLLDIYLRWVWTATEPVDLYLRNVAFGAGSFLALSVVPILVKWLLIGRWTAREIPLWSGAHLRLWTVKTLIRTSPMVMFAGSPLYLVYLRALGARVGRGVTVLSSTVPIGTDLLTIGDGTVIRPGASLTGYRAEAGLLRLGAVRIGAGVVVGEGAVLDVDTALGDGAQLGHASCLHRGQTVPARQRWHGSPARPTEVDFSAAPARCGSVRRFWYSSVQLINLLGLAPVVAAAVLWVLQHLAAVTNIIGPGPLAALRGGFYLEQLALSAVVFFGGLLAGLLCVITVPRLLNRALVPATVYRLYGLRYWVFRVVTRTTNAAFFVNLFGDSSYIVGYLRAVGYHVPRAGQTGSNFGAALSHATPYLCSVGAGTMVSDGVRLASAEFSATAFRTAGAVIGADSFLGNAITYPAGGRVGDNCLIGTKTMIPIHGKVRTGVALLGSPAFEIPRSATRGSDLDLTRSVFRQRLDAKNRHNVATMAIYLLAQWIRTYVNLLIGFTALNLYSNGLGMPGLAAGLLAVAVFNLAWSVLMERVGSGFRRLHPQYCSIYERYFWWHERYWKLSTQLPIFNGTAFKGLIWRLLGVRIGRRVFDDGCGISEKTLVTIGDDCVLNAGTVLQAHSMEDGVFKADRIAVGAGVTVGVGSFVHYGTIIGDGAVLAPDAFLMKGEQVPPHAHWQGNPACQLPPGQH